MILFSWFKKLFNRQEINQLGRWADALYPHPQDIEDRAELTSFTDEYLKCTHYWCFQGLCNIKGHIKNDLNPKKTYSNMTHNKAAIFICRHCGTTKLEY